MRVAHLKVVKPRYHDQGLSLRGPKGRGQNDPPHPHIAAAGFEDGEDVVLISKADFEALTDPQSISEAIRKLLD